MAMFPRPIRHRTPSEENLWSDYRIILFVHLLRQLALAGASVPSEPKRSTKQLKMRQQYKQRLQSIQHRDSGFLVAQFHQKF